MLFIVDLIYKSHQLRMKQGQSVYIQGETIETPSGKFPIKGGHAKLEALLYENDQVEIWLVYFTDDRYDLSVQRMFFKNNLPSTSNKEIKMATRKKVKKAAKKAVKKVAKKVAKKKSTPAKKKSDKVPLSRFVANLIVQGKLSDEKIVEKTQAEYPKYKHTDLKTVSYYRKFLNEGKLEKAGFKKPRKPYAQIGGVKKSAEKKTAQRKVAKRKSK
jgi:hypothetical protein